MDSNIKKTIIGVAVGGVLLAGATALTTKEEVFVPKDTETTEKSVKANTLTVKMALPDGKEHYREDVDIRKLVPAYELMKYQADHPGTAPMNHDSLKKFKAYYIYLLEEAKKNGVEGADEQLQILKDR